MYIKVHRSPLREIIILGECVLPNNWLHLYTEQLIGVLMREVRICPVCGNAFYSTTKKHISCDSKCSFLYNNLIKEELLLKRCLSENRLPYRTYYERPIMRTPFDVYYLRKTWFTGRPDRPD